MFLSISIESLSESIKISFVSASINSLTNSVPIPPQVQQPVAEAPAQIDVASLDDIFASTSTAPPVPALGLPEGWSMEQWEHYGAQWLEEQSAASDNSATGGLDFDL